MKFPTNCLSRATQEFSTSGWKSGEVKKSGLEVTWGVKHKSTRTFYCPAIPVAGKIISQDFIVSPKSDVFSCSFGIIKLLMLAFIIETKNN